MRNLSPPSVLPRTLTTRFVTMLRILMPVSEPKICVVVMGWRRGGEEVIIVIIGDEGVGKGRSEEEKGYLMIGGNRRGDNKTSYRTRAAERREDIVGERVEGYQAVHQKKEGMSSVL